jgi:hypothetical protein
MSVIAVPAWFTPPDILHTVGDSTAETASMRAPTYTTFGPLEIAVLTVFWA